MILPSTVRGHVSRLFFSLKVDDRCNVCLHPSLFSGSNDEMGGDEGEETRTAPEQEGAAAFEAKSRGGSKREGEGSQWGHEEEKIRE